MEFDEGAIEPADSAFVAAFKKGEEVQNLRVSSPSILPAWATSASPVWLAVPLKLRGEILGFIVLARPRAPVTLNWESFDLLRMIGRQVASYLAEERATRALADATLIIEYNKKFAFVVHDIKNLASQLGMLVSNIRRYSDNPEFRADMVRTLENSVARLNGLLSKLRSDKETTRAREALDPVPVIREVVGTLGRGRVRVEAEIRDGGARMSIGAEDLHSVLTHLVTNAIEASRDGDVVRVRLCSTEGHVMLDIEDKGSGMDLAFIRSELFTPLRSTRSHGHGIGAFQAREIVRSAGGDLNVVPATPECEAALNA
jgi:putative PEP-CTERM system histidine kinase